MKILQPILIVGLHQSLSIKIYCILETAFLFHFTLYQFYGLIHWKGTFAFLIVLKRFSVQFNAATDLILGMEPFPVLGFSGATMSICCRHPPHLITW